MLAENDHCMTAKLVRVIGLCLLGVFCVVMIFPFVIMVNTSLKTMQEIRSAEYKWIPERLQIGNYAAAMRRGTWPTYFFNSLYITLAAVVISLIINSLAGYAFARLRFRGRRTLFFAALVGIMIPPQVTILPVFIILKNMPLAGGNNLWGSGGFGLIDTHLGLLLPYIAGAFGVFLFRQFFLNFPRALDDAAKIDGLGRFRAFLMIYVPLSTPVFVTLLLLKATQVWNDYTWPLVLLNSDRLYTVQLALSKFQADINITLWNLLMAATTIIVVPLLIIFLLVQKQFIRGIVTTGIKG